VAERGRGLGPVAAVGVHGVSVRHAGRDLEAPAQATLAIERGSVAGIAGPSGSGKSTLVEVVLGLRTPDSGLVELIAADGQAVPLAEVDRAAWHARVAWVPQHPYCFPGTIAENLRLGRPEATDAEVQAALGRVGLGDLDPRTRLGEGGSGISSGQRRRIGVARALLRGGDLLIFDEPTAGLDVESERTVLEAIRATAHEDGRAVLLVAHRPAALAIADSITEIMSRAEPQAEPPAGGPVERAPAGAPA
jgi:ATP-binding cassette subfamily C protein CydCD